MNDSTVTLVIGGSSGMGLASAPFLCPIFKIEVAAKYF